MLPREHRLFWHITDINNMPSVFKNGGLLSRDYLRGFDIRFQDNSDKKCTEKRERLGLSMFVPFHFIPWSPSDFSFMLKGKRRLSSFCYVTLDHPTAEELKAQIVLEGPSDKQYLDLHDLDDKVRPAIDERRRHTDFRNRHDRFHALGECLVFERVGPENFFLIVVESEDDREIVKMYQPSWAECPIFVKPGYFGITPEFAKDFCPPSLGKLTREDIVEATKAVRLRQAKRAKRLPEPFPLFDERIDPNTGERIFRIY